MTISFVTPIVDALGPEGAVASALSKNVEPFEAAVIGYDEVRLTWSAPQPGTWTALMLVRSRSGYPRTSDDGIPVVTFDTPNWYQQNTYTETGLVGGWHYYSMFLRDAFGWQRVVTLDVLVPYDYGSTDKMWDTLPEHYRVIRDDTADMNLVNLRINADLYDDTAGGSSDNLTLSSFISIFGWGFDLLRTQAEGLLATYDPDLIHPSRLRLLSQQFGHEPEVAVPAHVNRTIVRNLAALYRERGTVSGIKALVASVSGWDVDVRVGPNMMLSEDQAAFTNPEVPEWDPTVRYMMGDLVQRGDWTYQALVDHVLADGEGPPLTATSNAYWQYVDYPRVVNGTRAVTGDVGSWQARLSGAAGDGATQGVTKLVKGALDPVTAKRHGAALQIARTSGNGSTWVDVISVPALATGMTAKPLILESGIPIPRPTLWESTRLYRTGEFTIYKGAAYEALYDTTSVPTNTTNWVRVGADDRIAFTASTYAHGPFVGGAAGTGGKTVGVRAYTYDRDGVVVDTLHSDALTWQAPVFDPFVEDATPLNGSRVAPTGQTWNTDAAGTWTIDRDNTGGWVSLPTSGRSHRWITSTADQRSIAVTYQSDPGTTRLAGIIFRRSGSGDFWIATQTGLYKVVASAARANPASGALTWAQFTKGQRMTVRLVGNVITVYRNGVSLGSATDSFNSTATQHGLGVEA